MAESGGSTTQKISMLIYWRKNCVFTSVVCGVRDATPYSSKYLALEINSFIMDKTLLMNTRVGNVRTATAEDID